jgi:glycosyltransferase involved in cell wall biosynthesis
VFVGQRGFILMNEQIKISIIVPVFNAETFLKSCIESILSQTLKNIELILIDDGSSDKSAAICDSFLSDKRVQVFHIKNSGPSAARNFGISHAHGNYIGFVDADDTVEPDMFETLYLNAQSEGADLSFCNFISEKQNGKEENKSDLSGKQVFSKDEIFKLIFPYFFGYSNREMKNYKGFSPFADYSSYIWLCIFKRSVIVQNNVAFMDQKKFFNEDNLFNMNFVFYSEKIVHSEKYLYHYRDSDNSLTKHYNPDFLSAKIRRFLYLFDFVKKNNLSDDFNKRIRNKICIESLYIINYYVNAKGIGFSEKYSKVRETVHNDVIKTAVKNLKLSPLGFSMLSVYLFFEKLKATPVVYLLSLAYNLIR